MKNVSNCCHAKLKVVGTPDFYVEGDDDVHTCYYICTKCEWACDVISKKTLKKVKKGLKEAAEGKIDGPYSSAEEVIHAINSNYNLLDYIEIFWYRYFWNYVSKIPLNIKSFIQRGIRGYSDMDCWDFDSYLEDVIEGGVTHLLLNSHYSDSKRIDDLTKIIDTMNTARAIKETHDKDLMKYRKQEFKKGMKVLTDKWHELWD